MKKTTGFLLLTLLPFSSFSQNIDIKGTVKDSSTGLGLAGVEVQLLRYGLSDTTDSNGIFSLFSTDVHHVYPTPSGSMRFRIDGKHFFFSKPVASIQTLSTFDLKGRRHCSNIKLVGDIGNIQLPEQSSNCIIYEVVEDKKQTFLGVFPTISLSGMKYELTGVAGKKLFYKSGYTTKLSSIPTDSLVLTKASYWSKTLFLNTLHQIDLQVALVSFDLNGIWNGLTSQDTSIAFRIAENGIDSFTITFSIDGNACSITSTTTSTYTTKQSVADGVFSLISKGSGPSAVSYTVDGSFETDTTASGSAIISFKQSSPNPSCTGSDTITWKAIKVQ